MAAQAEADAKLAHHQIHHGSHLCPVAEQHAVGERKRCHPDIGRSLDLHRGRRLHAGGGRDRLHQEELEGR